MDSEGRPRSPRQFLLAGILVTQQAAMTGAAARGVIEMHAASEKRECLEIRIERAPLVVDT